MPVSTSVQISHCLAHIIHLNPRSVLDVGCGFGMWGFLCRMYLDAGAERVLPKDWQVRVDGIEYFEPYILDHQRSLYDHITIGDIRDLAPKVGEYDLIIAGDVIEHLDKDDGKRVIAQLYAKARRALLINIPLGLGWDHPEAHGNPGELHRSQWYVEDFLPYPSVHMPFRLPCGDYGVFYLPKDVSPEDRAAALLAAAEHADGKGALAEAAGYLREARAIAPTFRDPLYYLADILVRMNAVDEAVTLFREAVKADPNDHDAALFLARLLTARARSGDAGAGREAGETLRTLLAGQEVPFACRTSAQELLERL